MQKNNNQQERANTARSPAQETRKSKRSMRLQEMHKLTKPLSGLILLVFLFTGACSGAASQNTPTPSQTSEVINYDDPFAYCAAIGTVDSPDPRYSGPDMPNSIIEAMIAKGIVATDVPPEFQKNAVWRCMNGQVWVCHFGANLPCLEKADTSKVPTIEMEDYCKANPSVDSIPAAVTGRATVYEWKCNSGQTEVARQVFHVDPQGYLADFWYELLPK
jgi:hypothetical protein